MKRLFLLVIIIPLLTSCAEMNAQREAELKKEYSDISECDMPKLDDRYKEINKTGFSDQLESQALSASADDYITKLKVERLGYAGWNESVLDSIYNCKSKQKEARIKLIKPIFEEIKLSTKNSEERKALILAYSSWEAYLNNFNNLSKQEFEKNLSYYKNM